MSDQQVIHSRQSSSHSPAEYSSYASGVSRQHQFSRQNNRGEVAINASNNQAWPTSIPNSSSMMQANCPIQVNVSQDGQALQRISTGDDLQQQQHMVLNGEGLTLVILDCSPQPDGEQGRAGSGRPGSSMSDCCQTELIIRQHCHSPAGSSQVSSRREPSPIPGQQQHQQFLAVENRGHSSGRQSASSSRNSEATTKSQSQFQQVEYSNIYQKEQQQQNELYENHNQHKPQYKQSQDFLSRRDDRIDGNQQYSQLLSQNNTTNNLSNQYQYQDQTRTHTNQSLARAQNQQSQPSGSIIYHEPQEIQNDQQEQFGSYVNPTSFHGELEQEEQDEVPLKPARPGYKYVKRWDWNLEKFVLSEVRDEPPPPRADSQSQYSRGPRGKRESEPSSRDRSKSTELWNELDPTTSNTTTILQSSQQQQVQHENQEQKVYGTANRRGSNSGIVQQVPGEPPAWLAYRVPDMDSVQSDPLYMDLMQELQRLEEGAETVAALRRQDPTPEPEVSQKPAIGQEIIPKHLELNEYEDAEFYCRIIPNSDPTMDICWLLNGEPVKESSRILKEFDFGVARLKIKRCEAEDSGIYICRATNLLGEAESTAKLQVKAKESIQYESLNPSGLEKIRQLENPRPADYAEDTSVEQAPKFVTHIVDYVEKNEGQSVHFECCLSPVDDPNLKTEWFFNGRPLVTGSRFHTIDDFGFIVLEIDWLFPRDTGEYVCRATNKFGTDFTRTVLRVNADRNIVLDSQLDNPNLIDKLRQLEFPDVPEEQVLEEPGKPARFVQHLRSAKNKRQFNEGDDVHFEARVAPATDGLLTVEWFHNDRPLISGHRFQPSFDFGHIILDILYVYPEDSGIYKCVARNETGTDTSQFEISVKGKPALNYNSQLGDDMIGGLKKITDMEAMWNRAPDPEEEEPPTERRAPEFVLKPKPYAAFEGSCARFCCRINAHPRARVTWTLNGQTVVSGSHFKLTYDGMNHLTIPKCQLSDAGKIEVYAKNPLGDCYAATELTVKRKVDDYRGVLKRSPNPWYDEQTLKLYRRQRMSQDIDEEDQDFQEFLAQRQQQQRSNLQLPGANQLRSAGTIAYMEPGTPDVNLLVGGSPATSIDASPLVMPGDFHPLVLQKEAMVLAKAPSTIQRAMQSKDDIKLPESNVHLEDVGSPKWRPSSSPRSSQGVSPIPSTVRDSQIASQQVPDSNFLTVPTPRTNPSPTAGTSKAAATKQQLPAGTLERARQRAIEENKAHELQRQQLEHQRQHQLEQQRFREENQRLQRAMTPTETRLPSPSPENVVHGKEVHSQTHKQTQLERRANREIKREIIEREIVEQEHKGVTKEIRGNSLERGFTPTRQLQDQADVASGGSLNRWQQQQRQDQQARSSLQQQQRPRQQRQVHFQNEVTLIEADQMIPPEFTLKIQPCQAIDGDEASFECAFIGEPVPVISWYRENKLIKASNLYSIVTDLSKLTSTLVIRRVTIGGEAVYTVKAENEAGSAKSSANLVVEPHPLPQASRGGKARQVDAEHYSTTDSQQFETFEENYISGELVSSGVSSHEQESQSQSQLGAGSKVVKSVRTRKLSPDDLAAMIRASPEGLVAPTFLHTIHDVSAKPGDVARLDARLLGAQPMDVRWLKDGQRVRADKRHKMVLEGDLYTLLILECSPQDEGVYECMASNRVGEAHCQARLFLSDSRSSMARSKTPERPTQVGFSSSSSSSTTTSMSTLTQQHQQQQHQASDSIPKLIKRLESQTVIEGKSVTLRCQISSFPPALVSWYKQDGQLIKPSKYFLIFKDNEETYCLRILETFAEDQGVYKCVARAPNGRAFVESEATITVLPNRNNNK